MRIGTDISLKTCKDEGYLMMEYKVKELTPKSGFNADANVTFLAHIPDYILEQMRKDGNWKIGDYRMILKVSLSANDVWEKYQNNKAGVDSICGYDEPWSFPFDASSLLNLASDVNSYCGLDR